MSQNRAPSLYYQLKCVFGTCSHHRTVPVIGYTNAHTPLLSRITCLPRALPADTVAASIRHVRPGLSPALESHWYASGALNTAHPGSTSVKFFVLGAPIKKT